MLLVVACTSPKPNMPLAAASSTTPTTTAYLALGDSYTIGESVAESARWPVQLATMLRKVGVSVANPDIIARTGWTTAELQEAIDASGNKHTYGLVSLLIGVNNQYRGQSVDTYRTEFKQLLQRAVQFAGGNATHVFVLSIPDWGVTLYASGRNRATIAADIDHFNAVAQAECQQAGIAWVDITPISRRAEGDATQFADDGLHYSGKHMQQWAEKALPVVKTLVTN